MLFLETEHRGLREALEARVGVKAPRPIPALQVRLCDFDDIQYKLDISNDVLTLSMAYPFYGSIQGLGVQSMLAQRYPEFSLPAPESGFSLTLQISTDHITTKNADDIISRMAALKRNTLASPFEQCFRALQQGKATELSVAHINSRRDESIYVLPQKDRIVVVFSIVFEDKTDQAIARVFLQELVDTRRTVNNAPPVSFSKDPPLELKGAPLHLCKNVVGYLSFAIFPEHIETQEKCEQAATLLQGFRNYLHYHIKSAKTYLHIRMRKRVDLLLQVLNRARPERDISKISKKTISGRTSVRN